MITLRALHGEAFVNDMRKVYDESRHYLKNCGKPKDWYDIWLINYHKSNCNLTRHYVVDDKGF